MTIHNIEFSDFFVVDDKFFEKLFSNNPVEANKIKEILDYIYYKSGNAFSSRIVKDKFTSNIKESSAFKVLNNVLFYEYDLDTTDLTVEQSVVDIVNINVRYHKHTYLITGGQEYGFSEEDVPDDYKLHKDVLLYTTDEFFDKIKQDKEFQNYLKELRNNSN